MPKIGTDYNSQSDSQPNDPFGGTIIAVLSHLPGALMQYLNVVRMILIVCLLSFTAEAQLLEFTPSDQIKLPEETIFLVTHAGTMWNYSASIKPELDRMISAAKRQNIPAIYLMGTLRDAWGNYTARENYFFEDWNPTYAVQSSGGYFNFEFAARHVITSGGFYDACYSATIESILKGHFKKSLNQQIVITNLADATYVGRRSNLGEYIRRAQNQKEKRNAIYIERYKYLFESFVPERKFEIWLDGSLIYRSSSMKKREKPNLIFRVLTQDFTSDPQKVWYPYEIGSHSE